MLRLTCALKQTVISQWHAHYAERNLGRVKSVQIFFKNCKKNVAQYRGMNSCVLFFQWSRDSGVFRGRATVRCPPLAGPWKFFTGDFKRKGAFFAIFQQELQNSTMFDSLWRFQISEKWANLRFPLNIQKQKVSQLQGAKPPDLPTRGSAPGPHRPPL